MINMKKVLVFKQDLVDYRKRGNMGTITITPSEFEQQSFVFRLKYRLDRNLYRSAKEYFNLNPLESKFLVELEDR